jgi:hypothetical protein
MGLVMDLASYNTDKMGYVAFGWWMGVFCRSGQLSGPRWVWRFARTIISDRGASRLCRELPVSLSDFSSAEVESPNMSCRFKGSLGPSTSSVPWGMSTQVSYHSWNRQRWKSVRVHFSTPTPSTFCVDLSAQHHSLTENYSNTRC